MLKLRGEENPPSPSYVSPRTGKALWDRVVLSLETLDLCPELMHVHHNVVKKKVGGAAEVMS